MEDVILSPITPDELIQRVAEAIANLMREQPQPGEPQPDLLTTKEACELLKITQVTLWRWEKQNKVKSHGIGGKRYYKRPELLEALTPKK